MGSRSGQPPSPPTDLPPVPSTGPPDSSTSLPPGPRLPGFVQTALWALRPGALARHCRRRYGETFTLRVLGVGDVVLVTRPETIRAVFAGDRDVFHAGEANAVMGPVVGRHSLLLLDGERHLRHRRLLSPPFHGEAVRVYRERVARIAAAEVAGWPVGEVFPIRPRMQAITLEVILTAVIGVSDERRLERLRELLTRVTDVGLIEMWIAWSRPGLIRRPRLRRLTVLRLMSEVHSLLDAEIAAHRAAPEGREDVLAQLLAARDDRGEGLTDAELRDHLMTLLVAGHETTTTGLAWCFERLLRHPDALARAEEEIAGDGGNGTASGHREDGAPAGAGTGTASGHREGGAPAGAGAETAGGHREDGARAGEQGGYLEAVVNETLRVRPVIDSVWRKLVTPAEVEGRLLPAGTVVMPGIELVHASGAFADAERFRPERFLRGGAPPYTFIPFGGGPRRCIGASFALMEMRTVLRVVLENVQLRAPEARSERVKVHHITLVPARGGRVVVTRRRSLREPEGRAAALAAA